MFLDRHICTDGHVVHLGVELTASGWDVHEEVDATLVHVEHHADWHRVERALRVLELAVLRHGVSTQTLA